MTTELQIRANQQNAQLSTGPRSEEGKRKVSLNSITHGLRAKPVVLRDEDAQAFEQMRTILLATLRPVGDLETLLADRAAIALWRLHRVLALEGRRLLARSKRVRGRGSARTGQARQPHCRRLRQPLGAWAVPPWQASGARRGVTQGRHCRSGPCGIPGARAALEATLG